jgi:ABC-type bacteriocin/lantibiotic exporter with double-glycine peptidase domain
MIKTRALLLFFACIGFAGIWVSEAGEPPFVPWRTPNNGGVNALYCYLRINGVTCGYDDLLKRRDEQLVGNTPLTAGILAKLSAQTGYPLRVVMLDMKKIVTCRFPIIVHMDGESPDVGAFLLVLHMSPRGITYINGPSASLHEMSMESFRRVWSGVVLVPETQGWKKFILFLVGVGLGGLSWLVYRRVSSAS